MSVFARSALRALVLSAVAGAAMAQQPSHVPPTIFKPAPAKPPATIDPALLKDAAAEFEKVYDFLQRRFYTAGGPAEGMRMVDVMQGRFPQNPYSYLALAELKFMQSGGSSSRTNSDEATALARKASAMAPDIPDGYILLAKIAVEQRDRHGAMEMAARAVKLAPKKPEAQFALGRALQLMGRYDEAEAAFTAAANAMDNPHRKANIQFWLGQVLIDDDRLDADVQKSLPRAKAAFRSATELNPQSAVLAAHYGSFLLRHLGEAAEAENALLRSLKLEPRLTAARFDWALAQYAKWAGDYVSGKVRTAGTSVAKATGLGPDYAFTRAAQYKALADVPIALLRAGDIANIDTQDATYPCNCTALTSAAYGGNLKVVAELVKRGANVNAAVNAQKRSPLMYAVMNGDLPMTEVLLANGARVNVSDAGGWTPLGFAMAAKQDNVPLVRTLLKHKADLTLPGRGSTPLIVMAIQNDKLDVLRLLVNDYKVDVKRTEGANSPLFMAIAGARVEMVELLLAAGANPHEQWGRHDIPTTIAQMQKTHAEKERLERIRQMVIAAMKSKPARP